MFGVGDIIETAAEVVACIVDRKTTRDKERKERTMERIVAILEMLEPGIDYRACTTLVDDRHLDSLTIVALVAELEDAFDITIPAVAITADAFNSVEGIYALVMRLAEEERG